MKRPSRKIFYLTKRVEFSAAHRLYKEELSQEENWQLFGKCSNPYGHGHTYTLEATFRGEQDPNTEMVIHFAKMGQLLRELVVDPMDHHHLNHDVAFLEGVLPTAENIISILWDRINGAITDSPFSLHKIRFASSPRSYVEYRGPSEEEI